MKAYSPFYLAPLLWACTFHSLFAQSTSLDSARYWLTQAQISLDSGQYKAAEKWSGNAFRIFREHQEINTAETAQAAALNGQACLQQDSLQQAKTMLANAVKLWRTVYPDGSLDEVRVRLDLCTVLRKMDDADGSINEGLNTLSLLDQLSIRKGPERITTLRFIGRIYFGIGQYNNAIPYYEEGLQLARAHFGEQHIEIARILIRLGYCYEYIGAHEKALAAEETALSIQQKVLPPVHPERGSAYLALGTCMQSLKKYKNALEYYQKALDIQIKTDGENNALVAYSYSKIGQVYLENHDYVKALSCFQKSDTVLLYNHAENSVSYAFTCKDLGTAYFGLKQYPKALDWFEKAAVLFRGNEEPGREMVNADLNNVIFQMGRTQAAAGAYEAALQLFNKNQELQKTLFGPDCPLLFESEAEMGYTYLLWYQDTHRDDLLENSRDLFRQAEKGFSRYLRNEESEETQKKLLSEAIPLFERAIRAEIQAYHKNQDPEALENAWKYSETMHGYMLLKAAKEADARHFADIPDMELRRDSVLRAEITALQIERQYLAENKGLSINDPLVLAANKRIFDKKEEHHQLLATFEKQYPDYFRLKYETQTASLGEIQQALSLDQTLLEYFTGDSLVFLFVVQHEKAQVLQIARNFPLDDWTQALRQGITGYHTAAKKTPQLYEKTVRQYADAAQKIYGKLLAPAAASLRPELIVVPGDGFTDIPFEALLSGTPKDLSNFNTYPFLLRRNTIHYAYSGTMWQQMSERKHRRPAEGLLAFAPFFEADTAALAIRLQREMSFRQGIAPLPYSGEEVFRAQKRYGAHADVLLGESATKQKFLELAGQYRILHLATHGKSNSHEGDFSFLAFASENGDYEAGLISAGELYNLPINADLVLLSACETGIGEEQRGEGMVSLARAFAFAGAKSIVASLWSVNDQSTMQVMDRFYAELLSGKTKNAALANAKRQYLESFPGINAHPFFWAGFVAVGDASKLKN